VHEHTQSYIFSHARETNLVKSEHKGFLPSLVNVVKYAIDVGGHDFDSHIVLDNRCHRSLSKYQSIVESALRLVA
jgi:hypothetical protein